METLTMETSTELNTMASAISDNILHTAETKEVAEYCHNHDPARQSEVATVNSTLRNRTKQRPDALEHLIAPEEPVLDSDANNATLYHYTSIAFSLMSLDALALNTFGDSFHDASSALIGREIFDHCHSSASKDVDELACYYRGEMNADIQASARVMNKTLRWDDIYDTIVRSRTDENHGYSQFIRLRTLMYTMSKTENYLVLSMDANSITIPEELAMNIKSPQQYLRFIQTEFSENKQKLRLSIARCRRLRDHVREVAELNIGTPETLESLISALEALQENFYEACVEAEVDISPLLDQSDKWWDLTAEPEEQSSVNVPPPNAAIAYPKSTNFNSILTFLVPTICLISCVPAALAWTHTPSQVGSYSDGNFYQLVSSFGTQLLGILTLVYPALFSDRIIGLPRTLALVLVMVSLLCNVVSVPLYLYAPTAWTGLLSFCGAIAQVLVLLQLVQAL